MGLVALALGYVVPTVGVAAGPAVPPATTPTASADAPPSPAGTLRRLRDGGRVVTFSEQPRSETAGSPFATRKVIDAGLTAGTTVVDAPGVQGAHTVLFEDQLADGVVVDSTLLQETSTRPAERVVRVGSKGTLIDVWLTCDAAIQWGRRQVTIYVLAN